MAEVSGGTQRRKVIVVICFCIRAATVRERQGTLKRELRCRSLTIAALIVMLLFERREACLPEMIVECEGVGDSAVPHELETHTVGE